MILTAVQQGKTLVRIITDKGTYYAAGVLQGYTATNVSVKATEKSATIRICNEKRNDGAHCQLPALAVR